MEDLIKTYRFSDRCASIRVKWLTILQTENNREFNVSTMIREGKKAIEEDFAEVLILGSARMRGLAGLIQEELPIPPIDLVLASLSVMEMLLYSNNSTNKINLSSTPDHEEIK
ncbi:MAG: hypothetical protein QW478_03375 [Candidatus Micrarchaeaceae archaeon]